MKVQKESFGRKLAAYSLAAGAAAVATNAATSQAAMNVYDNGGAGWTDVASAFNQDTVSFKMDGTVVLNSGDTGLLSLGQDADSFTFQAISPFLWWGTEEKEGYMLHTGANVGYMAGGSVWDVARAYGEIGPTLPAGRQWSDSSVTDTGGLGGWNFYFAGEWPFGGSGFVGLYADDIDGRHYGWASITSPALLPYTSLKLRAFAFSDIPGMGVYRGGGEVGFPGDFNGDIVVDALDIDILCDNMGGDPGTYDLNDDSVVDEGDLVYLVETILGTYMGDFNLDGVVNATDLGTMSTNFGLSSLGWAGGNANCDDVINATDLGLLSSNFGLGGGGSSVPEPATLGLLALGASGLVARRRRKR